MPPIIRWHESCELGVTCQVLATLLTILTPASLCAPVLCVFSCFLTFPTQAVPQPSYSVTCTPSNHQQYRHQVATSDSGKVDGTKPCSKISCHVKAFSGTSSIGATSALLNVDARGNMVMCVLRIRSCTRGSKMHQVLATPGFDFFVCGELRCCD